MWIILSLSLSDTHTKEWPPPLQDSCVRYPLFFTHEGGFTLTYASHNAYWGVKEIRAQLNNIQSAAATLTNQTHLQNSTPEIWPFLLQSHCNHHLTHFSMYILNFILFIHLYCSEVKRLINCECFTWAVVAYNMIKNLFHRQKCVFVNSLEKNLEFSLHWYCIYERGWYIR